MGLGVPGRSLGAAVREGADNRAFHKLAPAHRAPEKAGTAHARSDFAFDFGLALSEEQAQEVPEVKEMVDNPPDWLED